MAQILFVRHSRWTYLPNAGKQMLNPEGVEMAKELAPKTGVFDLAYCSEYPRAKQTVEILAGSSYKVEPTLNELFCPENFDTPAKYAHHMFHHHIEEVRAKADALQRFVLSLPPTDRVLCVSHGVTLAALYVGIQHGGREPIEPRNWDRIEFQPLNGFYVWTGGKKIISVKIFEP